MYFSAGNAAAVEGSFVRNVSFFVRNRITHFTFESRKSLLCKAGMANSRNTCVDMRLACVACRPLGGTRLLCCLPSLPSSWLSRNLSNSSPLVRFPVSYMHPDPRRQLYPSLYCSSIPYYASNFSLSARKLSFHKFPYAQIPLACALTMARNSRNLLDLFDSFTRERFKAAKEYLSSRCKHAHISCNKLSRIN